MIYRCVAASVAGFVQQLAVSYIANGYYFYVSGSIPSIKDPSRTDAKIILQYAIAISKWARARKKKLGNAGVQYLRYDRFFVIMANHGAHPFFAAEAGQIRDIRRQPLYFMGYTIGCRTGRDGGTLHPSVHIDGAVFRELKHWFERAAVYQSVDQLREDLRSIPYEPYAPVRNQLRTLVRLVNQRRKAAGLELVPPQAVWRQRKPVLPFGQSEYAH